MKIILLTNEYPPHVYGGAGVHVEYLSRELSGLEAGGHSLTILCFGEQREYRESTIVKGIHLPLELSSRESAHKKLLDTLLRNVLMMGAVEKADIVHCHTWYTYLAGCLIKEIFSIPMVITTHSLEPQRPWKEEQLGPAYKASTWLERTAYQNANGVIAVSQSMQIAVHDLYKIPLDKIRVIPNGIDTDQYKPTFNPGLLVSYNIDPDKPFILFVGRLTRQKGIIYLVNAIKYLSPGTQVVLCSGAPDTEMIVREMEDRVREANTKSSNKIIWINKILPRNELVCFYSHASVFVCPSVYEPFGIVNLEAMACGTPVVASAVDGIREVVIPGETGWLVPFKKKESNNSEPRDPEKFSQDLAAAINDLILTPQKIIAFSRKCRQRVERHFSWSGVARQTLEFYQDLVKFRNI